MPCFFFEIFVSFVIFVVRLSKPNIHQILPVRLFFTTLISTITNRYSCLTDKLTLTVGSAISYHKAHQEHQGCHAFFEIFVSFVIFVVRLSKPNIHQILPVRLFLTTLISTITNRYSCMTDELTLTVGSAISYHKAHQEHQGCYASFLKSL